MSGPKTLLSNELIAQKYCVRGEDYRELCNRVAGALTEDTKEFRALRGLLLDQKFWFGGRIMRAVGSGTEATPCNCFASGTIEDSMEGIMDRAKEAALTMKAGGGIGYDFTPIRGRGSEIRSLGSPASGPVSFMRVFDTVCGTVASAGNRRGAQMAVLHVRHPDIREYVGAKANETEFRNFNLSVAVSDEFMASTERKDRDLWESIMRHTWDWAEPGVLFIDTINRMNNLWYCEKIATTNPCGEQPLPPHGACILGSFNVAKYVTPDRQLDLGALATDVPIIVRAMDNVIDLGPWPLEAQAEEAAAKRRVGVGLTGVANALEACGFLYGTPGFLMQLRRLGMVLRDAAYRASCRLAAERKPFPMFHRDSYLSGQFVSTLPRDVRDLIGKYGIRNSHLLTIAPTGTISLCMDNVSPSIEPVFAVEYERDVRVPGGVKKEIVRDYGYDKFGVSPRVATDLSAREHVDVVATAQRHVDASVSKTVTCAPNMPWEEFKQVYWYAWEQGCKGLTTFNPAGKRFGIARVDGAACYIDPDTGKRSCE